MIKKFIYPLILLFLILCIIICYLSVFGISTNKFNKNISNKIEKNFPKLNFEFDKINLLLNPLNFTVELKTKNSIIKYKNIKIFNKEISTEYNFLAFIKKEFGIKNIYFETKKNQIKDIIKIVRSNNDNAQLFILHNLIKDGQIILKAELYFDENGEIKDDFKVLGKVENLSLKLFNKKELKNINTNFNYINKNLILENIKFNFHELDILSKKISIKKIDNSYNINGSFENKISSISQNILNIVFQKKIFEDVILSSENIFTLNIDKGYKISDLNIKSSIDLKHAYIIYKNQNLKSIIPNFKDKFELKDNKINIDFNKKIKLKGKGKFRIDGKEDEIIYNFNNLKDETQYDLNILFEQIPLKFDIINFTKKEGVKGNFKINIKNRKKDILVEKFSLKSQNGDFNLENIIFNNKFEISKFDKIDILFKDDRNLQNDLNILRKNNQYLISGNQFAIDKLVEEILTGENKKNLNLFDNSNKTFTFNVKKAFIDNEHDLLNLTGEFLLKRNNIKELKLLSNFKDNENVSLSIKSIDNNKITIFYSDLAKPFVKKFKFIKGFENGKIDFTSTKNKGASNSVLKIYDFKLKEVPVLTKILTLASLQGISDLLTGEGVRFDEFEMLFTNKDNLTQIDEIYSIGPAISILMEGYIQSNELISLKGTLVPATTINKFVASIPVLGEILVGKKTGEGVFGVSFKIKGHPKDLKTTVNPIKTLTPRFITRTLEKIKKGN